jgi:hypothetical protein
MASACVARASNSRLDSLAGVWSLAFFRAAFLPA